MQDLGRVLECDLNNRTFEEFADLARISIESVDRSLSMENLDPPWSPLSDSYTGEPRTILDEQEIRHLEPIRLKPVRDGSPVVAVDVSILGLGETKNGVLYAIRGTVVSKEKRYRYRRLGPLLFHINIGDKHIPDGDPRMHHITLPTDMRGGGGVNIPKGLLTVFETMLKGRVVKKYSGAVLLWDGSLTIPSFEGGVKATTLLLELARERENRIIGLSKETCLLPTQGTMYPLRGRPEPCLIDIDHTVQRTRRLLLLGKVYLAKLARKGLSFRLDVDRELSETERITAVEKMIGNDLIQDGYPETLRLAHIFSKFNAAEVIGMHRFLDENYGLRALEYPNIRRILFGPFGGSHSREQDITYVKPL